MPPAMWMQFDALDPTGKIVFIASGMNSMYLTEWDHIYIHWPEVVLLFAQIFISNNVKM